MSRLNRVNGDGLGPTEFVAGGTGNPPRVPGVMNRRELMMRGLFGAGYVGLRAMATGLPAWFLMNPRKASAQDMTCAITAKDKMQFLIVSASSAGDSISCNCPGTYGSTTIIHPADTTMAATDFTLGGKTVTAAAPWAALTQAVRNRTNFFHHITG